MKKILIIGILFLFGIVSCHFPNKKESKPFRIAVSNLPETLDPIMRNEVFTNIATSNLFENLFYWENSLLVPGLAVEWYYKNKEKTILEIKLRKNVFFHNMTIMTSKDVAASIMRAMNEKKSIYYSSKKNNIDSIKIVDEYTLDIICSKYNKDLLSHLANYPIYSYYLLNQLDNEHIAKNPIGTGSFMFDSSTKNSISFKKFPNYWDKKQSLENIALVKVPSKEKQIDALLNGDIDFIISPKIDKIKKIIFSKQADLISKRSNCIMYMMLNVSTKNINGKPNPLKNILVRKAIINALDLDTFISQYLKNKATRINMPYLPSLLGYDPKYPLSKYFPAKSKKLLEKAGYKNGFDMPILCIKNKYMGDSLSGAFIENSLKKIGIRAKLKFYNSKEFYKRIDNKEGLAYITGYSYAGENLSHRLKSLYANFPKVSHLNRYKNEIIGFNKKINKLNDLLDKLGKKCVSVSEVTELAYSSKNIIPLYYPKGLFAISSKYEFIENNPYIFYFDNFREKRK